MDVEEEDIAIALEFRNLIAELESIAEEIFRHDFTLALKEKLLKIHERLHTDLEALLEHARRDVARVERSISHLPAEHEARGLFAELRDSLHRAEQELERENYKECMSEILVFLDYLRALEIALS